MSILGLSAEELAVLRSWLLVTVDSPCLADWEFESLIGSSRAEARRWIHAGLPQAEYDEHLLDRIVAMLSVLAGSAGATHDQPSAIAPGAIEHMLEKLFWSTEEVRSNRSAQRSSVTLRPGIQAKPAAPTARKRRASSRR